MKPFKRKKRKLRSRTRLKQLQQLQQIRRPSYDQYQGRELKRQKAILNGSLKPHQKKNKINSKNILDEFNDLFDLKELEINNSSSEKKNRKRTKSIQTVILDEMSEEEIKEKQNEEMQETINLISDNEDMKMEEENLNDLNDNSEADDIHEDLKEEYESLSQLQNFPISASVLKQFMIENPKPDKSLSAIERLEMVNPPENYNMSNRDNYGKWSFLKEPMSIEEFYDEEKILFLTGFSKSDLNELYEIISHEVIFVGDEDINLCHYEKRRLEATLSKEIQNRTFTYKSNLIILLTLLRTGCNYITVYHLLNLDSVYTTYGYKTPQNKSNVIQRVIQHVYIDMKSLMEKKFIDLIRESSFLNISFGRLLTLDELKSNKLLAHVYYAIDSRTQRVKSQFILKEKEKNKQDKFYVDIDYNENENLEEKSLFVRNKSLYSKKTNSSGLKIETITNFYGLIVYHSLVTNGSTHDYSLHRMNSFANSLQGKFVLGDSGYIGNDKNILSRIKINELPPEKRKDNLYIKKLCYYNDVQSKLRMVVEDMYGRACTIFKWINNSPYSHMNFTKMIMEMTLPLINFHILRYPLKKRYTISDGIMTLEEYELLNFRDNIFKKLNENNGETNKMDNYTSEYIKYIGMLKSFQSEREKKRKDSIENSSLARMKKLENNNKCQMKHQIQIKEKKDVKISEEQKIQKDAICTLKTNKMLHSDCLNIYLNHLISKYGHISNTYVFDTFFFEKMKQKYQQRKKYLENKINMCLSKENIVIIKHYKNHYILYFVTFGTANNSSSNNENNLSSYSSIFIFDSLNITESIDNDDKKAIEYLIIQIQKRKKQLDSKNKIIQKQDINVVIIETLKQRNGIDCGVFCCFYINQIMKTNPNSISQLIEIATNKCVLNFREIMCEEIEHINNQLN